MAIQNRFLWRVTTRVPDSREVLDSNGGLLAGRIDLDGSLFDPTKSKFVTTFSDGTKKTVASFSEFVTGIKGVIESPASSQTVTIYVPLDDDLTMGIFSVHAEVDVGAGGDGDFVTHPELDTVVSVLQNNLDLKVAQGDVPRVSKGSAQSTSPIAALAAGADLATVITKVNEVISTLNTVRSTAGAGLNAANGVIDALQSGKVMKS